MFGSEKILPKPISAGPPPAASCSEIDRDQSECEESVKSDAGRTKEKHTYALHLGPL